MKKSIKIDKIDVGMQLAQDVLNPDGKLLIKESSIITANFLNKIKSLTSYSSLYINLPQAKIDIIVETPSKKSIKLNSRDIEIKHLKNKIEVKKKLKEIEKNVEKSFHNLSINERDETAKKEIDLAVEDIKKNININMDLLEEITAIKKVDEYLYNHSLNVAILAHLIGKWLDLPEEDLDILTKAGLLHDIGKLKITPEVLNKPSRLDEKEFEIMKTHSVLSYKTLKNAGYTNEALLKAIILHHEKEDGSGYPLGIVGNNIPLHAKIISVADIFDAMTSERVYKKRVSPFKVLEMFQNEAFGKLDLYITMIFVRKFSEYYIGSHVALSNGETGKIIYLNHYEVNKPLISTDDGHFLDISKMRSVEIIDFLTIEELRDKVSK